MRRNITEGRTRVNKYRSDGPVGYRTASGKAGRRPDPTIGRREDPTAIVIRQPAPRCGTDEGPAKTGIVKPIAVGEGRPTKCGTKRTPAVAEATKRIPRAVGVEVAEPRGVGGRIHVQRRVVGGCYNGVDAAGNPRVEVVVIGEASNFGILGIGGVNRIGLAFLERGRLVREERGDMALLDFDGTTIVKIVEAEFRSTIGFDGEIATSDAEIFSSSGVNVESTGALPKDETSNAGAIFQRKIVELEDGVSVQKGHGSAFKFHFGTACVCGEGVTLPDGKIERSAFPSGGRIGHRIFVERLSEADIALDETEANDADMRCVGE